jgi:[acyl-carrier-protein] S-malonyltransferase
MGVTLIFPGQGSQYVGMGKSLDSLPSALKVFNSANEACGFDLKSLMFEGPEESLKLTENTQPAIVTHSVALFEILKEHLDKKEIKIDRVLGHSVGEYSALVAAGSLELKDAVKAVKNRGRFMQEAAPEGVGKMFAMLRIPSEIVAKACTEVSTEAEQVMPANFNEPTQTVISGHAGACDKAIKWIEENFEGRFRAMELSVSAPFHSTLMKPAEKNLEEFLDNIEIKENVLPYITNIDAKTSSPGTSPEKIKQSLIQQVCGSVLWSQSIASLPSDTVFIEVGPGKVLKGLNKKINSEMRTYNLDCEEGFEGLEGFLNECNL